MLEFFKKLFDSDFMPHGHCYFWQPEIVWLHALSDALITLAYYSIPVTLVYFVRKRRDLAFHWIFLMFGTFIFACGTTHIMEVWTLWKPVYRLSGIIKLSTALVSLITAVVLISLVPKALSLPSPALLEKTNKKLQEQITERQQAEEKTREMTVQLEQTAKLATMGELAASIAHELNNPLATITLWVESLMTQTQDDDTKHRGLQVIESEVERMGNLVSNLLEFTHRGASQISTSVVGEEIENTLELMYYHLRKRNITVVREFSPDVPPFEADPQQLRQLFLNIITNASDAMPTGGTLTIHTQAQTHPNQITVEFVDTGRGISSDDLAKIKEPFFTTKAQGQGTGLGLAICQRIVNEHQGTLTIESEVGRGTTVRITLPTTGGRQRANEALA